MNCSSCSRHVAEALEKLVGVASVNVDLSAGRAQIKWASMPEDGAERTVRAVEAAGFQARLVPKASPEAEAPAAPDVLARWRFNVIFGAVLTLPLMLGEWVFHAGQEGWFKWLGFALASPVMVVCGRSFFVGAWRQLKCGQSNMDTLVSLGSTTAFGYSVAGLFAGWPGHLYFMEAASIITLISTGHWMEALAGQRAEQSLRALLHLAPATARRMEANGPAREVSVAELQPGDRVMLRPGDRVPTDGVVADGSSAVDESMLTGESMPVEKGAGAAVYGGTLNQSSHLIVRVTATGEATALAQIIAVVQRAQASRAGIQKLADRVSSVFVPVVVLLALLTGLTWGLAYREMAAAHGWLAGLLWHVMLPVSPLAAAVASAAAVLIVACPCAMGLATPAAIMAGTNAAARRGILIRDGAALEKAGSITVVLFDKTGTLTEGRVTVAEQRDLRSGDATPSIGELAASLAAPSSHPLSVALAALSVNRRGTEAWQEIRGRGVEGHLVGGGETRYRLGALAWLEEAGVDLAPSAGAVQAWSAQGSSVLGLALDRQLIGLFALRDPLKADASEVVSELDRHGVRVFLVSGDNALAAGAVGREVGIPVEQVFADVRPEKKAALVEQLQAQGERVAFVGDGINDAPALEQADLGIAVSRASDVAREAADIILLRSDIRAVPQALALAHATLRTIRQNLFWAFFYNVAAVPLAVLGFLSPVVCAAAMGMSDLIVIGNALRLFRWRG